MKKVTIYQAKTNLSKIIQEVLAGEEVIIAKGNNPLVKLVRLNDQNGQRVIGRLAGKIEIADDFDNVPDDFSEYVG